MNHTDPGLITIAAAMQVLTDEASSRGVPTNNFAALIEFIQRPDIIEKLQFKEPVQSKLVEFLSSQDPRFYLTGRTKQHMQR